jgi:hypothetical protein
VSTIGRIVKPIRPLGFMIGRIGRRRGQDAEATASAASRSSPSLWLIGKLPIWTQLRRRLVAARPTRPGLQASSRRGPAAWRTFFVLLLLGMPAGVRDRESRSVTLGHLASRPCSAIASSLSPGKPYKSDFAEGLSTGAMHFFQAAPRWRGPSAASWRWHRA